MKASTIAAVLSVLVLAIGAGCGGSEGRPGGGAGAAVTGAWYGILSTGGAQLRVVVHIDSGSDGGLVATMDSPDQGAEGIPVDSVAFANGRLRLDVPAVQGGYDGELQPDGSISGEWSQFDNVTPLDLSRDVAAGTPARPQEPAGSVPYDEEEVQFDNVPAAITLAGTLTIPGTRGPHPAVVLISGSGAQDRNSEVFGHRPFLVLADFLTRQGLTVLRYDDRGFGQSGGDRTSATTQDYASDARAAVEFLKARGDVDAGHIGLVGHSEGGGIAAMVAAGSDDVAFVVLLAAMGMPGERVLYRQGELLLRASGASEAVVRASRTMQEKAFAVVKQAAPNEDIVPALREVFRTALADAGDEVAAELEGQLTEEAVDAQVAALASPWFRFFLTHDPAGDMRRVEVPVLALNGAKDLQVPAKENLAAIEEALVAGDNQDYTVAELPGLNHLFQTAETGTVEEYARTEETLAPRALELIGEWIEDRVGNR